MGISRYTLYKYVKVDGTWRYCKAAYHGNGKPDIAVVAHPELRDDEYLRIRALLLIRASGSGVDQPVGVFECRLNFLNHFPWGGLVDAET